MIFCLVINKSLSPPAWNVSDVTSQVPRPILHSHVAWNYRTIHWAFLLEPRPLSAPDVETLLKGCRGKLLAHAMPGALIPNYIGWLQKQFPVRLLLLQQGTGSLIFHPNKIQVRIHKPLNRSSCQVITSKHSPFTHRQQKWASLLHSYESIWALHLERLL